MLTWERFHNNNEGEWPIRPDGIPFANSAGAFCFLLNTDTGANDKELILNADPTGNSNCLELNTSTT